MKHQNQKNSFNPILRKHLNADALFSDIYTDFSKVSDPRQGNITIPLADALMSGFAMFSLKDPSLPPAHQNHIIKGLKVKSGRNQRY